MVRASTLIPAFIIAIGLAGASLAMAAEPSADNAKQTSTSDAHPEQGHDAKTSDDACTNAAGGACQAQGN